MTFFKIMFFKVSKVRKRKKEKKKWKPKNRNLRPLPPPPPKKTNGFFFIGMKRMLPLKFELFCE